MRNYNPYNPIICQIRKLAYDRLKAVWGASVGSRSR